MEGEWYSSVVLRMKTKGEEEVLLPWFINSSQGSYNLKNRLLSSIVLHRLAMLMVYMLLWLG